jgi:hypothetical protein
MSLSMRFVYAGAPVLAVAAALLAAEVAPEQQTPDTARGLLSKWVQTQQIIAKEQKDWEQAQEILKSRIELLKAEVAQVHGKRDEIRTTSKETGTKSSEMNTQETELKSAGRQLAATVKDLESDVRHIHESLPDPARARVAPLYARMPLDPDTTNISLAERFQNVVGIFNELGKINGEITLANEVRTLADGKPSEVQVVYLGLGQAYYVSSGGEAGIGRPGSNGAWEWQADKSLAPQVMEAVAILNSKAKPRFIQLPVRIQ